jgi:hypothetical protein
VRKAPFCVSRRVVSLIALLAAPTLLMAQGTFCPATFSFPGGSTQGWNVETASGNPLWHINNNTCGSEQAGHSSPFTFYYGIDSLCNYNDPGGRSASNLISPTIAVSGLTAPVTLNFNYLLQVEGDPGFDQVNIDVSTNGGATYTNILTKASLTNDNAWHSTFADITAVLGAASSAVLRFRFDSIDGLFNTTTGWMVDDIAICGTGAVPTASPITLTLLGLMLATLGVLVLRRRVQFVA